MHLRTALLAAIPLVAAAPLSAQEDGNDGGEAMMIIEDDGPEPVIVPLDAASIEASVDAMMQEYQLSGVVHIVRDGEVLLSKAYGEADRASGRANEIDTIFGIGSRPIDFTIAAVMKLSQDGLVDLNDPLSRFYPEAPSDRAGMTLRHMINGQSGLPDFPAYESDWDADLGWIDRAEFERRSMEVPLLFEPGSDQMHSHWAYGLLAAIVERVSGTTYETYLRENFFDPAGMDHTGNYGDRGDHAVEDFAAGDGVQVGLPNIPPNWGPTSWLVKGSGGMYSNLPDLLRFYEFVGDEGGLEERYASFFNSMRAGVDGSERGFGLGSFWTEGREDIVFIFANRSAMRAEESLFPSLIEFLRRD